MPIDIVVFLILLLPALGGATIGILGRRTGERIARLGVATQAIAFFLSIWVLFDVSLDGTIWTVDLQSAASAKGSLFQFGLYVDRLSGVMMVVITGIGTVIHLFSIRYMQQDAGYPRFYALLGLTTAVLLGMVVSPNLLILFVFWQLLGWLLYFLVGYQYSDLPTCREAGITFLMHRIGDLFFFLGVLLAYHSYGTLDFPLLFVRAQEIPVTYALWPGGGLSIDGVTLITLLIFVGEMSKSTQFPLHVWLPGSMYSPTPVSALMHAGIVNAGGVLLNRLAPLYAQSPTTLHLVLAVGTVTALFGAGLMLVQNNIKKTLAFSTIGQMGYMIMECGLGAFALAIFHLIAHGLFKATLFMGSGGVIQNARREPREPPKSKTTESPPLSGLTWLTGVAMTLILPLVILLTAHGVLRIPLKNAQGILIFLFFGWLTSSQAILSLYRFQPASWKVAVGMIVTLVLVVFTYLWAGEAFTHFLYSPEEVGRFFKAAELPSGLFDLLVFIVTFAVILVWLFSYANARGEQILKPAWVASLQTDLYILFLNGFYINQFYARFGRRLTRLAHYVDHRFLWWLP
ncbi:MAG: proton-conducting transporter membrane subunit [Candidatus Manganitrophaceae bacterium]